MGLEDRMFARRFERLASAGWGKMRDIVNFMNFAVRGRSVPAA
jgi:hypothetical protein